MKRLKGTVCVFFAALLQAAAAMGASCLSNATGNWSAAGTWTSCNGTTPQAADTVQIRGGNTVTMNTTATVASLQVGSTSGSNTSVLSFAAGSSLTVSGTITMSGNNGNRNGTITMTNGGTLIANGSPAFAFGSGTETWTPGTGTVQLGSTNTLPWAAGVLSTFNNLIIAANTTTLGGATTVTGNLTVNGTLAGTTTMSLTGVGATISGTGSITNTGTITITGNKTVSNTAVLEIAGPLTISTGTTTNNGTLCFGLSGGGACPSITGDLLTVTGTLANVGTLNTSSAISIGGTLTNTGTVTTSDTVTGIGGAGTYTNGINSTLNIGGPLSVTTFAATATGNTVNYNGTGAQTVRTTSFYNLTLSGARGANNLTLPSGATVNVAGNFDASATFTTGGYVVTNNTINFNGTGAQTVGAFDYNNLTISGAHTTNSVTFANGGTVRIAGTFTPGATFTSGGYVVTNNTIEYNGSAAQTLNVFTFNNLNINNAAGLTLSAGNATVGGTLALMSGLITTTGANTVITTASCAAPSVSRTSGHIVGRLQKTIPTGASTCVFEVGGSSATDYMPIQTSYASVTSTGNVLALVTSVDHPSLSGSGIDTTQSVNRYWTLAAPVTGALPSAGAGATYDVQCTFVPAVAGEVDAGANPLVFVMKRFASSTWSGVTLASQTATSTGGTALAMTTGYGDFAVGEAAVVNFSREQQFIYSRELY